MLSKNKIKYIKSLELKKNRKAENVFVAEGPKVVGDLLTAGFQPTIIVAMQEWFDNNVKAILPYNSTNTKSYNQNNSNSCEFITVTDDELRRVSFLQHPQQVLAVFKKSAKNSSSAENDDEIPSKDYFKENLCLALDGVQDPGNLGTIIRLADWFGIEHILCSRETADAFAPKVVQATMGSIARVKIHYISLIDKLKALAKDVQIYGTLLDGNNIYEDKLSNNGIIVMGNEGNGISQEIRDIVNHKLLIPSFPPNRPTAESLNVAIATAIVCAEFRRPNS